jgi:hypothetical protein
MSTAAVFLDIKNAFDTTWHPGLLYKLSKSQFPTNLIKLITNLYNFYTNDTTLTSSVNLSLFADDTCLYATDRKEGYVLRKIQRGLNSMATWCKRWNIKINENKISAIYFTHRNRQPDFLLTLN